MAQHRTRTLMYPLNRRFMLSDRITEERRREIITDRANFLVEYESHLIPEDREGWISQGWDGDGRQYPWTPERLHAVLEGYGKMWRESPDHAEFVSVFRKLAREKRLPNINRIVCFGHGPPGGLGIRGTNEGDDDETRYGNDLIGNGRSCLQYAAALDFAQLISGLTHGRPIDVWVQDPFLTRTDIQALELYGVRVANPYMQEGYTLVDRNTFVIGIFVNREAHLEAMCLEGGRPALIIWTDVKNAETRKVPERAAALDILAREYDTVKPIKALGEPDEDEDEDEDEDGEELSSSSSATGSSSSPPPAAASSAFSLPESWVLVYREDPPLARSTMYVPKAAKRPAVRDDDSNTTSVQGEASREHAGGACKARVLRGVRVDGRGQQRKRQTDEGGLDARCHLPRSALAHSRLPRPLLPHRAAPARLGGLAARRGEKEGR